MIVLAVRIVRESGGHLLVRTCSPSIWLVLAAIRDDVYGNKVLTFLSLLYVGKTGWARPCN